ncbi:MAG: CHASE3 domain-containing protein [Bacteroidetes bacterium]|nr:CHASE3 domain-containing protein [Bacteroidota bacterium]
MKKKVIQNIWLPFFFVLVLIGSIGYAVYQSNRKMLDSAKWVDHTIEIISLSEKTLSHTKDIETGALGYVITNDSVFLQPNLIAKDVIYKNIAVLKTLTKIKPGQQVLLDSLKYYIQKRIAFIDQGIELINKIGLANALKNIKKEEGNYYSNQIRLIIGKIIAKEYEYLQQRKLLNEKDIIIFNWVIGSLFALMSIASVLFLISYHRNITQKNDKIVQADELVILNNELKISEAKYQKLNEELEYLVIERTAKYEAANKELESFSYSVSHDLRAPIRAINGYTKILEEDYLDKLDADGVTVLASIVSNSKKMGHLIDDLLAFSKLGRKAISGSEIDMQEMVSTLCDEISIENPESQIEFTIHPLTHIYGDSSLIHQVWINLISNSVKFSKYKPKTIIEIGCYQKDDHTVYYVKDNGAGFDMKYYNKLFGVFQRLHGQDEFEGTGIGLAIVQKIVTRHNGLVWGESVLNEGARFYFSMPNEKNVVSELSN